MVGRTDALPPEGPDELAARGDSLPPMPGGMRWTWELDLNAVLAAASGAAPWLRAPADPAADPGPADPDPATGADPADPAADDDAEEQEPDPEADEAEYQEAVAAGRVRTIPMELIAGRIAETLPTGPGLAAWLGQASAADLEDGALAGIAASFHRMAAWAAAGELAAVAQIASRSAKTDRRAEVDADGRPDKVTSDAAGQVALALAMSHDGATSWADLGIVLTWRLPATGAALAAGEIDLSRARMIARMTSLLSEDAARQVEAAVLGRAGWLTLGQLHAALRRAVIKADPKGAEERRKKAEREATVALYPEDEGTATLAGYSLPGVEAAAAMARITALAKAMKAAGTDGQIDWLRAHVFLGLLLGTLSSLDEPPAPGGPDDPGSSPPPDGQPPSSTPPQSQPPAEPSDGGEPAGGASPPSGSSPAWPGIAPYLPWPMPADATQSGPAGLLNLAVPVATLAGPSATPGQLSWLGVVTAAQARQLGELAARHPATRWRIVVVNPAGQAIAVTHVPRSRSPGRDTEQATSGIGLIRRVTLVAAVDELANGPPSAAAVGNPELAVILDRAIIAARRAAAAAADRDKEDRRAGGCAHQLASKAYRPPPRVAELVIARDRTCRFPPCRRPAEQCDLDHTLPYDQGGRTCICNLGGASFT